jgi:hypothetical protein
MDYGLNVRLSGTNDIIARLWGVVAAVSVDAFECFSE